MTDAEKRAAIATYHNPEARKEAIVLSVWEDGEITMEKGAELFGHRNCHMLSPGDAAKAWDKELFPMQNAKHGRITVSDQDAARAFAAILLGKEPMAF